MGIKFSEPTKYFAGAHQFSERNYFSLSIQAYFIISQAASIKSCCFGIAGPFSDPQLGKELQGIKIQEGLNGWSNTCKPLHSSGKLPCILLVAAVKNIAFMCTISNMSS